MTFTFDDLDPIYVFMGCGAFAVMLVVEAAYLTFYKAKSYRTNVNRRLEL